MCVVANIQRLADYKITRRIQGSNHVLPYYRDDSCILDSVIIFQNKKKYKYII